MSIFACRAVGSPPPVEPTETDILGWNGTASQPSTPPWLMLETVVSEGSSQLLPWATAVTADEQLVGLVRSGTTGASLGQESPVGPKSAKHSPLYSSCARSAGPPQKVPDV